MPTTKPARPCTQQEQDLHDLRALHRSQRGHEQARASRTAWQQRHQQATGSLPVNPEEADDLFVRHTCSSMLTLLALQAGYGLPVADMARRDPQDLLRGRTLTQTTGLTNIVPGNPPDWTLPAGGDAIVQRMAQRIEHTRPGVNAIIGAYQDLVPARTLNPRGEHQTPRWLADMVLQELGADPLTQSVLDPTCGAGACVAAAVSRHQQAARSTGMTPRETLGSLQEMTAGVEINPAALSVARAAWALAARQTVQAVAREQPNPSRVVIPLWQGDALQPGRAPPGAQATPPGAVTINLVDTPATQPGEARTAGSAIVPEPAPEIHLPTSIAQNPEAMTDLLDHAVKALQAGHPAVEALASVHLPDPQHRETLATTLRTIQDVHRQHGAAGWEPQLRRLIHPLALSLNQRDIVVGNPPWITYHQAGPALKQQLRHLGQDVYGIWQGAHQATQQDAAGITFARCTHLYLRPGGRIAMVMPRSALQGRQFARWRSGAWHPTGHRAARPGDQLLTLSVDFAVHQPWDLAPMAGSSNNPFPLPASVVFARKNTSDQPPVALTGPVQAWYPGTGQQAPRRERRPLPPEDGGRRSPYAQHTRSGATIYPRRLFYVVPDRDDGTAGQHPQSRTGRGDSPQNPGAILVRDAPTRLQRLPWSRLGHPEDTPHPVEPEHLLPVHTGSTIAPHLVLMPLTAALPVSPARSLVMDPRGPGGIDPDSLGVHMEQRWRRASQLWQQHRQPLSPEDLARRLDYHQDLTAQLHWQQNPGTRPLRVAYTQAGRPTAAILPNPQDLVDYRLAWVTCVTPDEAHYLTAIINSDALLKAVTPIMSQGNYGPRDLGQGLWRLPIPAFDNDRPLHRRLAQAGTALGDLAEQTITTNHPTGGEWTGARARNLLRHHLAGTDLHRQNEKDVITLLEETARDDVPGLLTP